MKRDHYPKVMQQLSKILLFSFILITLQEISFFQSREVKADYLGNKTWSHEDIMKLGYMPGKILIEFKKDAVNLKTAEGKKFVQDFLRKKSNELAPLIVDKLTMKGKLAPGEATVQKIYDLRQNLITHDKDYTDENGSVLKLAIDDSVLEIVDELKKADFVKNATPSYVGRVNSAPSEDDYTYGQLWGLYNIGATIDPYSYNTNNPDPSNIDPDIQANLAWNKFTGNTSKIVAILDTGIDYSHPDLDGNMWSPSGTCYDANGDAIGGGCPNHGWNYLTTPSSDDPMDDYWHGTHMAGIIGASEGDNGVVGTNWSTKLMALKVADSNGDIVDTDDVLNAISFARHNGANIINASFTLNSDPALLEATIENFVNAGGLFVAAAGNSRSDLSTVSAYPAEYDLDGASFDNLLSVASTDQADEVWDEAAGNFGSNYGDVEVDLAAPGANIYSTAWSSGVGSTYGTSNGTSQSTAFVSGVADLVWGYRTTLTAQQVKKAILESGDYVADLDPATGGHPTVTGKRLNAYKALLAADGALVVPTIKSITGSGNWNSTSTWIGGVVPTTTDVVEIDGTITLNTNATIKGLLVNSGKTLRSYTSSTYTLTLSGDNADLKNVGTIQDYSSGHINIVVGGNMENAGTISSYNLDIAHNLNNSGTLNPYFGATVAGNLKNSGTVSKPITLDGATAQTIEASASLNSLTLSNSASTIGNMTVAGTLTVNSGKTLTIGGSDTITVGGGLSNSGTITGGILSLTGSSQTISICGTLSPATLSLASGSRVLSQNCTLGGNFETISGSTLKPYGNYTNPLTTLTINGNLTNGGTIQNETSPTNPGRLTLAVSGSSTNTGTLSHYILDANGSLTNSGTLSQNYGVYVAGALNNSGTVATGIYLDGASTQSVEASASLYSLALSNNATLTGNVTVSSGLTTNTAKTLSFDSGNTLTVGGTLANSGTISGGTLTMNGASKYLTSSGTLTLTKLYLSSGTTIVNQNSILDGELEVASGAILKPYGSGSNPLYTITINGDLTNAGTIQDMTSPPSTPGRLTLKITNDSTNSGTVTNTDDQAFWTANGSDSYDFQVTDTGYNWLTPTSTGTNTYSSIKSYLSQSRKWRWRGVTGGTPSDWSAEHLIN